MKLRHAIPYLTAMALVGAFAFSVAGQSTVVQHEPVDMVLWNDCASEGGEYVHVQGRLTTHTMTHTDAAGTLHLNQKLLLAADGSGQSSDGEYRLHSATRTNMTMAPAVFPCQMTYQVVFRLEQRHGDGDFEIRSMVHLTLAPDGRPTASVEEFEFDCRER